MKGVDSTPDALINYEESKALYPDTSYRFESGGHPDHIPELTQEAFESFHKTYYAPENAYICLYGNLDISEALKHLNDEYLNNFERSKDFSLEIGIQNPPERTQEVIGFYPLGSNESINNKTYHELQIVTGLATDDKIMRG